MPKTRPVEPEKQLLLANISETTFISRQRLGKHVSAAMDTHATIEVLLETVFSTRSMPRSYQQDTKLELSQLSVESRVVKRRLGGWCEMTASL
jgi:hypothetical protein